MKSETKYIGLVGVVLVAVIAVLVISVINIGEPGGKPIIGGEDIEINTFNSIEEMKTFLEENSGGSFGRNNIFAESTKSVGVPSAGIVAAQADSSGGGADDFSQTNVQVEGVDEPDIVKNDGKYIYTVVDGNVVIVDAFPAEEMRIVSEIEIDNVRNIFVNGDKLVVLYTDYEYIDTGARCAGIPAYGVRCGGYSKQTTHVNTYDIRDKENPLLDDEFMVDGGYVDARMIDEYVYVISTQTIYYNNFDILPSYSLNGVAEIARPSDIRYFPGGDTSHSFNSIIALNLDNGKVNREVYLLGASRTIFVSRDNIYLTNTKQISYKVYFETYVDEVLMEVLPFELANEVADIMDSDDSTREKENKIEDILEEYANDLEGNELSDFSKDFEESLVDFNENIAKEREKTVAHRINIDRDKITYIASGAVPGRILNQFSMGENDGYFSIATTTGNFWGGSSENNLYILNRKMEIVGAVEGLAPGERIYSTRFLGNRAYMVTFKKVDPLFVIDIEDPENPEVLGYLKITGFSDYLHPYDENHIIGIGKETIAASDADIARRGLEFAWYQGVKISLFDVTDVENPREVAKIEIGDRGTDSFALRDHKAFLFDRERNLLVIPIALSEIDESRYAGGEIPPTASGQRTWQGAFVLDISLDGIFERGRITHYDEDDTLNRWYYGGQKAIQRSLYMDDVLYTISQSKIKANDLKSIEEISSVDMPIDVKDYLVPEILF